MNCFSPSFWDVRDQSPVLKFIGSLHPELKTWPKHPISNFTPSPTQTIHPFWFMPIVIQDEVIPIPIRGRCAKALRDKCALRKFWAGQHGRSRCNMNVGVCEELKEADGEGLDPSGLILKATKKRWWFKEGSDRIQCKPLAAMLGKSRDRYVNAKEESMVTSSESQWEWKLRTWCYVWYQGTCSFHRSNQ